MKLSFRRVRLWSEAHDLMTVRNACREGMTHNTAEISVDEQRRFYEHELQSGHTYEAYVFYDELEPMGYGLIKKDGKRAWMTYGIVPEYRGRKLSRIQIQMVTQMGYLAAPEVWID